jgi:hypothetical protein
VSAAIAWVNVHLDVAAETMERAKGIEPSYAAWKLHLPLNSYHKVAILFGNCSGTARDRIWFIVQLPGGRFIMNLEEELAELQDALATSDFRAACKRTSESQEYLVSYLIVKALQHIKIKIDGNKNHKRPHVHIDYGRQFHAASYAIDTGERLVGKLDKYDGEVGAWIRTHRPKLFQAWELVQTGRDAGPIAFELRAD